MGFGIRLFPPSAEAVEAEPSAGPVPQPVDHPWSGKPDAAACNVATVSLAINVKQRLTVDGRFQAETLMVGIGAVAGFCAHHAFLAANRSGRALHGRDYRTVKTADGLYTFSDALDAYLIPTGPAIPGRPTLWGSLLGAAVQAGAPVASMPAPGAISIKVAKSVGTRRFGTVDAAPGHTPLLQPLPVLDALWPLARLCLTNKWPEDRDCGAATLAHWPAIASFVAADYLAQVKRVLDPRIAATLALQAAAITSKIQPSRVADGQFRPGEFQL